MPAEKFYPPTAVENKPSDRFEINWQRDYPGVYVTMIMTGAAEAGPEGGPSTPVDRVSGVELDRSGLNRLIRVLRRARDATYGADE